MQKKWLSDYPRIKLSVHYPCIKGSISQIMQSFVFVVFLSLPMLAASFHPINFSVKSSCCSNPQLFEKNIINISMTNVLNIYIKLQISQPISANFHPNPGQIQCFQVWEVLQNGAGARVMPFWAPYCAASLQILLSLGKTGMKAGVKKQQVWGYYVM